MKSRPAFTLFELILAIALSATLLALIGTAVNLYLLRVDAGRSRVEEAQLARSVLAIIAADVRATTTYQTQDVSAIARLAASAAKFDVDDFESSGTFQGSAFGAPGATGTTNTVGAASMLSATTSSGGSMSAGSSGDGTVSTSTAVPGLNGLTTELLLDVARLPRLDELFPTVPGQRTAAATAAAAANLPRPSDLKSVRYFIRQGTAIESSDLAATALGSPAAQLGVGGLVRQTIDRAVRETAEQAGNSQLLNSGQTLLAPEVTQIRFRYFDGTSVYDEWNMQERNALPTAIEVRIWLDPTGNSVSHSIATTPASNDRMYLETIALPLAQSTASAGTSGSSEDESTDEGDSGQGDDGTGFGAGAQFPP
jgi:hypothetical protein